MSEAAMIGMIVGVGIILGYVSGRIITLMRRIDGELVIHRSNLESNRRVLVQIRDELTAIRNATIRDTEVNPDA